MTNKEIVKAWYSALEVNDVTTIKNLMDNKYQFRNPISPMPIGAEEHLRMMDMMKSSFEARHEFDVFIEEENNVAVSGKWIAKHTGDFNGVPATGKSIKLYLIDIFNIVGGKVLFHHTEFNPMTIMAQIGVTPV
ncbi:MAG TPA: ester cyclase [Hanamia sp.]|nr:ester cyclase [Hanamia sp.]